MVFTVKGHEASLLVVCVISNNCVIFSQLLLFFSFFLSYKTLDEEDTLLFRAWTHTRRPTLPALSCHTARKWGTPSKLRLQRTQAVRQYWAWITQFIKEREKRRENNLCVFFRVNLPSSSSHALPSPLCDSATLFSRMRKKTEASKERRWMVPLGLL